MSDDYQRDLKRVRCTITEDSVMGTEQMGKPTVTEEGVAVCTYEPRGDFGLEGYQLNSNYLYQYMETALGEKYARVYPAAETKKSNYYETCRIGTFKRFFEPLN